MSRQSRFPDCLPGELLSLFNLGVYTRHTATRLTERDHMRFRSSEMAALFEIAVGASFSAQTSVTSSVQRAPSKAIRPVVVLSAQSLDDLKQKLQPDNKVEELIGGPGMELRVAVQHEKNKSGAPAELHDASDDVYYVLEGSATLVLGGTLEAPKEAEPGEWRSARIIDGRTVEINKGDLVVVPRGTPHQRS